MGQTKAQTANYSYVLIDEENRILVGVLDQSDRVLGALSSYLVQYEYVID